MFRRFGVVLMGWLLAAGTIQPSAQDQTIKLAMREKLSNTQALLDALVAGDFAAIGRHAGRMSRITEAEIASWQQTAHADYTAQAAVFLLSVKELSDAAGRQDIEAAGNEYGTLVSSCIRCHAFVRTRRIASAEPGRWIGVSP
jgi:hypothetical protein